MGIPVSVRASICILFLAATYVEARSQSLSGVKIGDTLDDAVRTVGSKPDVSQTMGPFKLIKWKFTDGNELSVTASTQSGRIVYAESDWGGQPAHAAFADFPNMLYGKTTLAQIRTKFGSNGMAFADRPVVAPTEKGMALFNAYEVGSLVVTFVTVVSKNDMSPRKGRDFTGGATLESISIADPSYAAVWGKRMMDSSYKKIEWR